MSFTAFTNIITILFCLAVLIQSVRMMRSLDQVRESQLDRTVGALDTATTKARSVLSEMKLILSTEGTANARTLNEARDVREELNVMVGIANSMAERLIEAASAGSRKDPGPIAERANSRKGKHTRSRRSAASRPGAKAQTGITANYSGGPAITPERPAPRKPDTRTPRASNPITDKREVA